MLEQTTEISQIVSLATSGQQAEAATLCKAILTTQPDHLPALLWLGYASPSQVDSENAIAKAYELQPQNPHVLKAVEWYNTHFIEPTATPASNSTPNTQVEEDKLHMPLDGPVMDSTSFLMSQSGGMIIGSGIVMFSNGWIALNYLVLQVVRWTPLGLPRPIFGILAAGLALIAAWFFYNAVRDYIAPPVKAYGFISNRKEAKQEVKDKISGTMTELTYQLDFLSDDDKEMGYAPIQLILTKDQFDASARSNRARVVYTKRLGHVKLYQPLRSVY